MGTYIRYIIYYPRGVPKTTTTHAGFMRSLNTAQTCKIKLKTKLTLCPACWRCLILATLWLGRTSAYTRVMPACLAMAAAVFLKEHKEVKKKTYFSEQCYGFGSASVCFGPSGSASGSFPFLIKVFNGLKYRRWLQITAKF
jgi:hypothetical protein